MTTLKQIIASLSEKEVRKLLEDAAQNSDYVADRLSELRPEANRANADFFMDRACDAVWDAFYEENDEDKTDYDGFLSFENTADEIETQTSKLLEAGLPEKAIELIDECEEKMPEEFCGECEDDLDSITWACKEARGLVYEKGGKAAREKLFEIFSRKLEDDEILDDNLRDRFNSSDFLPRKFALIEKTLQKIEIKGELGSFIGQSCLCLMLDLMDRKRRKPDDIRAFEKRYLDSGSRFNELVKKRRIERGETASAIELLERREKTPSVCRELITLYEKEKNIPKAVKELETLILLTLNDSYAREPGELAHLHDISPTDEWAKFAGKLLKDKNLGYEQKLYIFHTLRRTADLADTLLNLSESELNELHYPRWGFHYRNFNPVWRRLLFTYSDELFAAGYGPQILKACDHYLDYLEHAMNPELYAEGANALTDLRRIQGAVPICESRAKSWRVVLKRKRNLMAAMDRHGL